MHTLSIAFNRLDAVSPSTTMSAAARSVHRWWLSRRSAEPLCNVSQLAADCFTAEYLNFKFLDFQVILDTVSGSQCMLLLVIITVFLRSRRTVWSRALPDFKGPGSLAPFSLLSHDVSVSPSLSSGSESHVWPSWFCSCTPDFWFSLSTAYQRQRHNVS